MRRLALVCLALATFGCGGQVRPQATTAVPVTTTIASPTTTTTTAPTTTSLSAEQIAQAELEADTDLIADLYRDFSDSWFLGLEAGCETLAQHRRTT